MVRLFGVAVLVGLCALARAGDGPALQADGASLNVIAGATTLRFESPEIRDFQTTVSVPGDYDASFEAWDAWPGGTKDKILAVGISPKRDEQNTHVLGGLYRSVLPESVVITTADGSKTFKADEDYRLKDDWPQIAGIGGRLGTPGAGQLGVRLKYATQRLDLVQADAGGTLSVKRGKPVMVCPQLPEPDANHHAVAGVYVAPWRRDGRFVIASEDLYPIRPVDPVRPIRPEAAQHARAKLVAGERVTVAFVGDSVTLGAEAGAWWSDLWTDKNLCYASRVIVALRTRYPQATIVPVHAAQGGTTTQAAAGLFEAKVVPAKADVVMIAFGLNDAFGPVNQPPQNPPETYKEQIRDLIKRSHALGAEVILITPMQPNPWMRNKLAERIESYRKTLIDLAGEEKVGCADVHQAWLDQAKAGIPPFSQLHNWNNHPGPDAHKVYADTVLRFFETGDAMSATQPAQ